MPGAERLLDPKPVIAVEVLLFGIRQSHKKPVLNLLALRERAPGRIQAPEYLLLILLVVEADAYHPEPIETPEEEGNIMSGDQPPGGPLGLGYRAGTA